MDSFLPHLIPVKCYILLLGFYCMGEFMMQGMNKPTKVMFSNKNKFIDNVILSTKYHFSLWLIFFVSTFLQYISLTHFLDIKLVNYDLVSKETESWVA